MKELTESLEKYLLAIHKLTNEKDDIKVKDVAGYLKIGGPSTADAIRTLTERGFVNYVPYGSITLSEMGQKAVDDKLYRHTIIVDFLNQVLNIEKDSAEKNASAIEYSMTEDVLIKFVHFLEFMKRCSCKEPKWLKSCRENLEKGAMSEKCKECIETNKKGCSSCCGGN